MGFSMMMSVLSEQKMISVPHFVTTLVQATNELFRKHPAFREN